MPLVECPKCETSFKVTAAELDRMAECPHCQATFPAIEIDEFKRPEYDRADQTQAQRLIRGPAYALANTAIACLVANAFCGVGVFVYGFSRIRIFGVGRSPD